MNDTESFMCIRDNCTASDEDFIVLRMGRHSAVTVKVGAKNKLQRGVQIAAATDGFSSSSS